MTTLLIASLVLAASVAIVAEARRPGRVIGRMMWVRWGLGVRVVGAFGLAMTVYMFVDGAREGRLAMAVAASLLLGALAVPFFALVFFWRIGYGDDGICCVSPWRRTRQVPWSDVLGVAFSTPMRQWVIRTRTQGRIRVNELAVGSAGLITEMIARGVPVEVPAASKA